MRDHHACAELPTLLYFITNSFITYKNITCILNTMRQNQDFGDQDQHRIPEGKGGGSEMTVLLS